MQPSLFILTYSVSQL